MDEINNGFLQLHSFLVNHHHHHHQGVVPSTQGRYDKSFIDNCLSEALVQMLGLVDSGVRTHGRVSLLCPLNSS